jgi:hypothetical protein
MDSDNMQRFEGVASQSATSGTVGTIPVGTRVIVRCIIAGFFRPWSRYSNRNRQIEAKPPHQPEPADQRGTENGQLTTYIYVDTHAQGWAPPYSR